MNKVKISPKVNEKTLRQAESDNIYAFEAFGSVTEINKPLLKSMVEKQYEVNVLNVTALNQLGKKKRSGKLRSQYKRPDTKKFYVKLAEGEVIPEFSSLLESEQKS